MPTTSNKGYEVQVTGSNNNTWGNVLNDDVIEIIDSNLGGQTAKTLSSSNVTLTAEESEAAILRLTGTLSANVTVTTECIGFFFCENLTSGSFTVTVRNSSIVTGTTVPQGNRATLISTAAQGVRKVGQSPFPTGTIMSFFQTTPPDGWTKVTSFANHAVRIVSGTASSGGTVAFSTAFASKTVAGTVGSTVLTESQIPAHEHFVASTAASTASALSAANFLCSEANFASNFSYQLTGFATTATVGRSSSTGGGLGHNHSFAGTPINLDVLYVDCVLGTAQ